MKRKLVRQGNNALTVTIPRKWLEHYNLKAGDVIEINETCSELVISAKPVDEHRTVHVNLDQIKEIIPRCLHSLYRQGINEIHVSYSDISLMKEVHRTLSNNIVGFDIVEQQNNKAIIKNVADIKEENFDNLYRRLFRINLSMMESLSCALNAGNFTNLQAAIDLEAVNNRLSNYCRRCINKRLFEGQEMVLTYCALEVLERMGDELGFTMQYLMGHDIKVTENEKILAKEALLFYRFLCDSFFGTNMDNIISEAVKRKHLVDDTLHRFNKSRYKDIYVMHYLVNTIVYVIQLFSYKFQMGILTEKARKHII